MMVGIRQLSALAVGIKTVWPPSGVSGIHDCSSKVIPFVTIQKAIILSIVHCSGGCKNNLNLIAFAILSEIQGGLRS